MCVVAITILFLDRLRKKERLSSSSNEYLAPKAINNNYYPNSQRRFVTVPNCFSVASYTLYSLSSDRDGLFSLLFGAKKSSVCNLSTSVCCWKISFYERILNYFCNKYRFFFNTTLMLKGCFVGFVQYTIKRQILFYILASVFKGKIALLILFLNSVALRTTYWRLRRTNRQNKKANWCSFYSR